MITTNPQFDKIAGSLTTGCQEYSQFISESWNIAFQSASTVTKGYEELLSSVANLVKTCVENNIAASKAIASARSWQDAVQAQSQALRSQSEFLSSEVSRISELSSRVAQDALNPITEHVNNAVAKASRLAQAA